MITIADKIIFIGMSTNKGVLVKTLGIYETFFHYNDVKVVHKNINNYYLLTDSDTVGNLPQVKTVYGKVFKKYFELDNTYETV